MSFRKELKSTLNKRKVQDLMKWIFENKGKILYPARLINSIYYDNRNLSMYFHSVEGVVPRKKIRLRIYKNKNFLENLKNNANLEYKISSVEGRYKISKKYLSEKKNSNFKIKDKDYGICQPKLNVIYLRSYFKINNIRLTIDRDIVYKSINHLRISPHSIRDNLNVVEIKYMDNKLDSQVINSFPFQFSRFSKYCRGIEFTQKKQCDEVV